MGQESFISGLGQNAATSAVNGILGIALGGIQDRRQIKQQKKLTNIQLEANKNMAAYNYENQMRMWRETNYGPQMEEMRKAGINPALIYGDSGAGEQLNKWAHGAYILIKTHKKITYNANKTIGYIQYTREWRKHPQQELEFNN